MINLDQIRGGRDFTKPCRKIDLHTHLAKSNAGGGFYTAEVRMQADYFFDIDKCVILPLAGRTPDPRLEGKVVDSEDARQISAHWPEHFAWFCNLLPDGTDSTYRKLVQYKSEGALGFGECKELYRMDGPELWHLFACLQELDMPFLFHLSPDGKRPGVIDEPGLPLLEKALKQFPRLKFFGHSQPFWFEISAYPADLPAGQRDVYPSGKVKEGRLPHLFREYPNLYGDLSADSGGNAIMRDPEYGIAFLNEFQERLMFGTDSGSPTLTYPLGPYLDSLLHQLKLSEKVYRKIVRGNAERLLGI